MNSVVYEGWTGHFEISIPEYKAELVAIAQDDENVLIMADVPKEISDSLRNKFGKAEVEPE